MMRRAAGTHGAAVESRGRAHAVPPSREVHIDACCRFARRRGGRCRCGEAGGRSRALAPTETWRRTAAPTPRSRVRRAAEPRRPSRGSPAPPKPIDPAPPPPATPPPAPVAPPSAVDPGQPAPRRRRRRPRRSRGHPPRRRKRARRRPKRARRGRARGAAGRGRAPVRRLTADSAGGPRGGQPDAGAGVCRHQPGARHGAGARPRCRAG